ncbi:hypothetical protein [Paenibacillus sp. 1P07SE]|uniref:hypothetical protein n=1 Tax=Paenibacillus sp. 1P07SE TaxID=3132209 RepID=UPI0039A700A0
MLANPSWYFVIASVIAVVGIIIVYKQMITFILTEVDRRPDIPLLSLLNKQRTAFFIKLPIIELIPILLVAVGFMNVIDIPASLSFLDIAVPLAIVIGLLAGGVISIWMTTSVALSHVEVQGQGMTQSFKAMAILAIALMGAIPMTSLAAFFVLIA